MGKNRRLSVEEDFEPSKPYADKQRKKYNNNGRKRMLMGHTGRRDAYRYDMSTHRGQCYLRTQTEIYKKDKDSTGYGWRRSYVHADRLELSFEHHRGWERIPAMLAAASVAPPREGVRAEWGRKLVRCDKVTTYFTTPGLFADTPFALEMYWWVEPSYRVDANVDKFVVHHPHKLSARDVRLPDVLAQFGCDSYYVRLKASTRRRKRRHTKREALSPDAVDFALQGHTSCCAVDKSLEDIDVGGIACKEMTDTCSANASASSYSSRAHEDTACRHVPARDPSMRSCGGDSLSDFSMVEDDSFSVASTGYVEVVVDRNEAHDEDSSYANEDSGYSMVAADDDESSSCCTSPWSIVERPSTIAAAAPGLACAICLEEKPLIQLMKNCRCHPSACFECLRQHYIVNAQKGGEEESAGRYPLHCFWPSCQRTLRDVQVEKLVESQEEMDQYFKHEAAAKSRRVRMKNAAKALIREKQQEAHEQVKKESRTKRWRERLLRHFSEDETRLLLAALSAEGDSSDGLARCPTCLTLFIKDGGCDHMTCTVCQHEFSFVREMLCID